MKKNPNRSIKERARGSLRDALVKGRVEVPSACQKCGTPDRLCSDGRRYLHAHHPDHRKPLDVEWLCASCHRRVTPVPHGEQNGASRMTTSTVQEAIALATSGLSFTAIGARLGVDRRTVSRAVKGQSWKGASAARKAGAQ